MYRSTTPVHHHQQGMTVLEVAGVIVILAVLAAILFPVFARTDHGSHHISCLSNEKQIGLAMMQYFQDNDGIAPPRQSKDRGKPVSWRLVIFPYVKSKTVFQCPSGPYSTLPDIEHDGLTRSYAVNGTIGGSFGDDHPYLNTSKLKSPATLILVCESTSSFGDFDPLNPALFAKQADANGDTGSMQMHHEASNFLFADGHAKAINPLMTLGADARQPLNYWIIDNHPFDVDDLKTAQYTLGYAVEKGRR